MQRTLTLAAVVAVVAVVAGVAGAGCSSTPECAESVPSQCAPLYEPTFDNVFSRTLVRSCAQTGGACHATDGAQGGLVFADADAVHAALLAGDYIRPGDAACGQLIVRIEDLMGEVMPPGDPLTEAERCAIRTWAQRGALR